MALVEQIIGPVSRYTLLGIGNSAVGCKLERAPFAEFGHPALCAPRPFKIDYAQMLLRIADKEVEAPLDFQPVRK